MKNTLEETSKKMVDSLKAYAQEKGVDLQEIRNLFQTLDTAGLNALDDLFNDGGEGRFDYFSAFSIDYAIQFNKDITSDEYDERRWEVEVKAMKEF